MPLATNDIVKNELRKDVLNSSMSALSSMNDLPFLTSQPTPPTRESKPPNASLIPVLLDMSNLLAFASDEEPGLDVMRAG